MDPSNFTFSITEIEVKVVPPNISTNPPIFHELEIKSQATECQNYFASVWGKCQSVLSNHHQSSKEEVPSWCKWQVATWAKKPLEANEKRFTAWVGNVMAGFLNLRTNFECQSTTNKKVVYIEHLATAPGNIYNNLWGRRFHGVGTALLAFAILESEQSGYQGRVGLHASDLNAEKYYRDLKTATSKSVFSFFASGISSIVRPNQTIDPNLNRPYLETDSTAALELLEGYLK